MGLLGFIKDVALMPVDAALDLTGLSIIDAEMNDKENPIRTAQRLKSAFKNLDETLND